MITLLFQGDSGGPLYLKRVNNLTGQVLPRESPWYLIGVVSFGTRVWHNTPLTLSSVETIVTLAGVWERFPRHLLQGPEFPAMDPGNYHVTINVSLANI